MSVFASISASRSTNFLRRAARQAAVLVGAALDVSVARITTQSVWLKRLANVCAALAFISDLTTPTSLPVDERFTETWLPSTTGGASAFV